MSNDQELEIFDFTDEDGNTVTVQVLEYFYYNGKEYAVMTELTEEQAACQCNGQNCECEDAEVFFMEVVPIEGDDENVEFQAVEDDELADKLFDIVSANYSEDDGQDEE